MTEITAKQVKELRDQTGAGMMDAKKALVAANGDFAEAAEALKRKGLAKAAERSGREALQGAIAIASNDNVAALVQLTAETDFSAKGENFLNVCQEIAEAVLAEGKEAVAKFVDKVDELRIATKENIEIGQVVRMEAASGATLDTYLHRQDGRGVIGIILEGSGVSREDLHQVSLHAAFTRPKYLSRDEVPEEEVEQQRQKLLEVTKEEGKPEQAWEKIVEGRISGWFKESVLLEQGLQGEKTTVAQSLKDGTISRFAVVAIG